MNKYVGYSSFLEMSWFWILETSIYFMILAEFVLHSSEISSSFSVSIVNSSAILSLVMGGSASLIGLYQTHAYLKPWNLPAKVVATTLLSILVIWLFGHFSGFERTATRGLLWAAECALSWIGLIFTIRLLLNWAIRKNLLVRRIVIVGSPEQAAHISDGMASLRGGFYCIAGAFLGEDMFRWSPEALLREKVRHVILSPDSQARMPPNEIRRYRAARIRLWRSSDFWENQLGRIDVPQTALPNTTPFTGQIHKSLLSAGIRRGLDLVLSVTLLAWTLPVMAVAALLIKLETPGPVFYRQERVGLNGRVFKVCKFRSMRVDAEKSGPIWAAQRDPRVTRVGSIIRRTRVDELPQILSVLRGEMSFIGPRPERPYFVDQIAKIVPFYHDRTQVKPGLTGWAQVNFPYGASIEDARTKLSYDLYYIKNQSLFLDLLIIFSTFRVVLFQEGSR